MAAGKSNSIMVGKNLEMSIEGDILIMRVDLRKDFGVSPSGKTNCVASSGGNVKMFNVPGGESFQNIVASINVMRYPNRQ